MQFREGFEPLPGYRLAALLGQGGFGQVWRAVAPGGVEVALKFVRLNSKQASAELRALELVRNIRHPNLLDIHFIQPIDGYLVIAMSLCEKNLWDRLQERRAENQTGVPPRELIGYMEDVARALDFLNEPQHSGDVLVRPGVQHRDVKPQNILLLGGSVKLADYGLAKALASHSGAHSGSMTLAYAAPEMVLEGKLTRASDQFSLAATYCHLRCNCLPVHAASLPSIVNQHMSGSYRFDGLMDEERTVVARAMTRNPEERWPTCGEFVQALRQVLQREPLTLEEVGVSDEGRTTLPSPPGVVMPPPLRADGEPSLPPPTQKEDGRQRRRRSTGRKWLPVAGVLLCAGALPAFFYLTRSSPAEMPPAPKMESLPPAVLQDSIGAEFVLIQPGQYWMGSLQPPAELARAFGTERLDLFEGEFPPRRASIARPFYLCRHEVTVGQFRTFVEATGYVTDAERDREGGFGYAPSQEPPFLQDAEFHWRRCGFPQSDAHPVVNVSWNDANQFCQWLSGKENRVYRLPTEAEWEYACRAGAETHFFNGDLPAELTAVANVADQSLKRSVPQATHTVDEEDGYTFSAPVGKFQPNPLGLFDMHGNVWEWCEDAFEEKGPPIERVLRGGSWASQPHECRCARRNHGLPHERDQHTGFRILLEVP